ncbi:MAG: sugar phosphate isomerase/epimerase [Bryobacteraceae bacterium]
MKIGVNTLIWSAGFGAEHIPLMAEIKLHGFDAIEVARFDWSGFPAGDVGKEAKRLGLDVTVCTAFGSKDRSLVCDDAAIRSATRAYMKESIEATAAMGGRVLAGPFHSPVGHLPGRRRTEDEWKWEVDALRELGDHAAKHGVVLAVEPLNRFESYFLNTAADAARLCDEVAHANVGVLYDTFHANIEEKAQAGAIRTLGSHIFHVHSCENDRGAPGSGHVEWTEVMTALRAIGYDGYLVIESFGYAIKELAAAACIWRDLASSPAAIAWEGIEFLRRL